MSVSVLWHSLRVPWVGLQCVLVVFPDQTNLLLGQDCQLFMKLCQMQMLKSNQICMTQCACDDAGCAYLVGLQAVLIGNCIC